ncbi:MAG: group III truncated hemoglobin [Mycobacterium sp.]
MPDLASRADVEAVLWRFYDQVFADDLLAEPFAEVRGKGLSAHIPVMCEFWETLLFGAGLYRGSALAPHRQVHDRTPLSHMHFVRWLVLWNATVDEMYRGPAADHAKLQAARIARAMHRRLTGTDAGQLDALLVAAG